MGKQRRKRGNYAERKNKDGSISRFSIPTIKGKPKWVKIPNLPEYEGKRGARRHLEWCRQEYGADWTNETFTKAAAAHLEFIKDGKYGTYRVREQAIRNHLDAHFGRKRIAEIKRADVQEFIRLKTTSSRRSMCGSFSLPPCGRYCRHTLQTIVYRAMPPRGRPHFNTRHRKRHRRKSTERSRPKSQPMDAPSPTAVER